MPDSDPLSFLKRLFSGGGSPLSPTEFVSTRDASAPLLDVRTEAEVAGGGLRGARHADVTAADFRARVEQMSLPAEGPVYVYCASGMRSGRAVVILKQMGVSGAVNVGGIAALRAAGAV